METEGGRERERERERERDEGKARDWPAARITG